MSDFGLADPAIDINSVQTRAEKILLRAEHFTWHTRF